MHSFWQRLDRFSHRLTPAVLSALMVLLGAVPLRLAGAGQLMPAFTLINIYYWGVFAPGVLPYGFLFALGLLQDTLGGTPLGMSSFINMSFAFVLMSRRHVLGKTLFASVWMGFAALCCAALLLQWTILNLYAGRMLPVGPALMQWAATCLAYPPMHLLLTRVYRYLHS